MSDEVKDGVEAPSEGDQFLDIDPAFRGVAGKYGREMFALVMGAGMAGQAAAILGEVAGKHASRRGQHALGVLAQVYNGLSNSYVKQMGWTEELVAQCDRDIQLAFAGKLVVPGGAIILNS